MNQGQSSAVADTELVEMLIDQPELLAIADALRATRSEPLAVTARRRWLSRRRLASVAGIAAALAAAAALLLTSPWGRSPSFVEKALAAVGSEPVLHVVVVSQTGSPGGPVIDLNTGKTVVRTQQTEIWFDSERDLKKTIETVDGHVLDDMLETRQGGWSQAGPIITCSWIAAHPVEATRLRVSCNANGENGTTPRKIPETPPPPLDPALAGFVDHYRSALASGAAREVGRGHYGGHDVVWLEFNTNERMERVAVDAHTYEPLAIEGEFTLRVLEAEALAFSPGFFTKPTAVETQRGSTVTSSREVSPTAAASLLGGRALWFGQSWNGLTLVATTLQERTIGYGPGRERTQAEVVRFTYAPDTATGTPDTESRIDIYESTSCVVSVGWECNAQDPAQSGELKVFGWLGLLRSNGLYVSTWNLGNSHTSLDLARALIPVTG
jgi:hypothetical protein